MIFMENDSLCFVDGSNEILRSVQIVKDFCKSICVHTVLLVVNASIRVVFVT